VEGGEGGDAGEQGVCSIETGEGGKEGGGGVGLPMMPGGKQLPLVAKSLTVRGEGGGVSSLMSTLAVSSLAREKTARCYLFIKALSRLY
jgi:hypothetical protein